MEQTKREVDQTDTQALSGFVSRIIKLCVEECGGTSQDIVTICVAAAGSPVTLMGQLVGKDHKLTTESLLYVSLLLARAIQPETVEGDDNSEFGGCMMQNNPVIASEAMNDVRKLTGKEPTEYLHAPFIRAVEEGLRDPKIVRRLAGPSRYVH